MAGNYNEQIKLLNAVTATTTSAAAKVADAKKMSLHVIRANHSAGSSKFEVEISNDNSNWVAYNMLIDNVTNANTQTLTRVASKTLSSNTSAFLLFDDFPAFTYIRVIVTETTDGTHTAILHVQY